VAVVGEVNETTSIDAMCKDGIYPATYNQLISACMNVIENKKIRESIQNNAFSSIVRYPQKIFTQEVL
jgi:hypothetical protein